MSKQIPVDETDSLEWLFDNMMTDFEERREQGRLTWSEIHDEYHDTIDEVINPHCPYCQSETGTKEERPPVTSAEAETE